jgi:membrane-associated phospholipid phosphatase
VPRGWRPAVAVTGAAFVLAVDIALLILAWHYPSDILAGTMLAAGWAFAVLAARRWAEDLGEADPQSPSSAAIAVK